MMCVLHMINTNFNASITYVVGMTSVYCSVLVSINCNIFLG
jgi:hypothetical protein